jgi:hypothetical protein
MSRLDRASALPTDLICIRTYKYLAGQGKHSSLLALGVFDEARKVLWVCYERRQV